MDPEPRGSPVRAPRRVFWTLIVILSLFVLLLVLLS